MSTRLASNCSKRQSNCCSSVFSRYSLYFDENEQERHATVVGSPAHVIEQIHQLRSELGVDTILWQIDFGAMPGEEARRTLTLFIEQVLPYCP